MCLTYLHYFVAMLRMKLSDYLALKKTRVSHAARELGVSHQAMGLWVTGERMPRPPQIRAIYRWSKGQVQPNDFYDLSPAAAHDELPLFANGKAREATHERH